jgi:hypothetical protein
MFLVISAVLSLVTVRMYAHGHSPVANPGDHSVAALRGSLEKGPLRPSARHTHTCYSGFLRGSSSPRLTE